jgi:NMD protein affecting ribosome stability and mRNA decay
MTNANNVLLHIHTLLSKLPVTFREKVCEECNWSTPTFYRKVRSDAAKDLSNAEKEMIAAVIKEVVDELNETLKYPPFVAETPQLT